MCEQKGYEPVVVERPGGKKGLQIVHPRWKGRLDDGLDTLHLSSTLGWGDGHHPTTYLSLAFLADKVKEGHRILDYGTGSAILAMAAIRLGCKSVIGIDIDDEALVSMLHNVDLTRPGMQECG